MFSSYFNGFHLFLSGGLLPEKNVWAPVLEPRAEQKKRRQGIDEDMMELARFAVAAQQAALREREEQNLVSEAPRLALKSEKKKHGFSWIFINLSWIFHGFFHLEAPFREALSLFGAGFEALPGVYFGHLERPQLRLPSSTRMAWLQGLQWRKMREDTAPGPRNVNCHGQAEQRKRFQILDDKVLEQDPLR